uniref:Reverse transcriptase domain-containing protein n=1 Tax=Felis catus TaxID=9685 RepID=A0ABI7W6A9_FELCA
MPVSIRQYPMSKEAHMGIQPHITRFLELGVLRPCRSPWNTPLLPVKKPGTRDYRPVQDLREVNKRTMDIHPTVPNPYNLLSTLSPDRTWYTVLDLKDAFFCLPLAPQSQELFAFEWRDPKRGISGQLTWTRLPQGFKNSPTLFDEALHRDLTDFRTQHPEVTLLQYVDDLLLAAPTKEACILGTRHLLRELGEKDTGHPPRRPRFAKPRGRSAAATGPMDNQRTPNSLPGPPTGHRPHPIWTSGYLEPCHVATGTGRPTERTRLPASTG